MWKYYFVLSELKSEYPAVHIKEIVFLFKEKVHSMRITIQKIYTQFGKNQVENITHKTNKKKKNLHIPV